MSVKFASNLKYLLRFTYEVEGTIDQADVIGALFAQSAAAHMDYGLNKLQNTGKLGKLSIRKTFSANGLTKGIIEIPSDLDRIETAIFCTILEIYNKKVRIYPFKIKLDHIENQYKGSSALIINRALEIYTQYFDDEEQNPENIKKTLYELTSAKKAVSYGDFIIGSTFHRDKEVILVEGRADVMTLAKFGITNTFAVNGVHFDQLKVKEYLKDKEITLFVDGDRGGSEIERKITKELSIAYKVLTPKKYDVEDLNKSQLFELLEKKQKIN